MNLMTRNIEHEGVHLHQSSHHTWLKFLQITVMSPAVHAVALVVSSIAKMIFAESPFEFGKNFLILVFSPLIVAAFFMVALYGLLSPLINAAQACCTSSRKDHLDNASKLYASLERAVYKRSILSADFQPVQVQGSKGAFEITPIVPNVFGAQVSTFIEQLRADSP